MTILPAFSKNNIAIAFAINDFYVPIFAAVLESLVENSNSKNNYDILVMQCDVSIENQRRLRKILNDRRNFSLRFVDIGKYEKKFVKLWTHGHFAMETWFRLMLPEILLDYDKVLYLDADLIILKDVAELFRVKLNGKMLAAVKDADTAGLYNGYDPNKKSYMDQVLKLKNPYDYFQAGVILFNLAEFRKMYTTEEMLRFAASRKWQLLDQDVLNCLAQGKVKFVDMAWNVVYDWDFIRQKWIISRAPEDLRIEYREARKDPKIVHYAGPDKPWNEPAVDFGKYFWQYAKRTDFYNELKSKMPNQKKRHIKKIKKQLRKIGHIILPKRIKY